MLVELKQFVSLTGVTLDMSFVKMMSTHYNYDQSQTNRTRKVTWQSFCRTFLSYAEHAGAVFGRLNNLDGSQIALLGSYAGGQRHLWEAHRSRIRVIAGPRDLEHWNHGERVVCWLRAESQVDVDERRLMALEPTGLKSHGTAVDGPVCPVLRHREATA